MTQELPDDAWSTLRQLVDDLAAGRYEEVVADGRGGRLTAEELRRAVDEYPQTLAGLPEEARDDVDVYLVHGRTDLLALDVPMWTPQGRSDLTLSVTVDRANDRTKVEIDDLHVL